MNTSEKSAPTPMMVQYLEIKSANPGALLFYRMGDFYELFFDDAVVASEALDITLTKRGKQQGDDIPMCGVPVHSADAYLERLIRKGHRVAVCEQTENPSEAKKRGSKSVVARDVVRLVTPGTLTEDTLLDARAHTYLAAFHVLRGSGEAALAWLDISTGDFTCRPLDGADAAAEISRLAPGELLVSERLNGSEVLTNALAGQDIPRTVLPPQRFDADGGRQRLMGLLGVAALEGFGGYGRAELGACGALVDYVELTQKGKLPLIKPPRREIAGATMAIDAATRRNLELVRTLSGDRHGSLLATIDRTVTGAGARLLADRLAAPLTDPAAIASRQDTTTAFANDQSLRDTVRDYLKRTPDLERALARLSLNRGGPRDLAAIRDGLSSAADLHGVLEGHQNGVAEIAGAQAAFEGHGALISTLVEALGPDLPVLARDGGFIRAGHHGALDEFRSLRDESRQVIAGLESQYKSLSGINGLKVRHNNVLGYFVEVTANHGDKLMAAPLNETFIHRQTMANAVRFSTTELSELQGKITRATDQALVLELELFDDLAKAVLDHGAEIAACAAALACLDVAGALAQLAVERDWTRPAITTSTGFRIEGGRHPVVEAALEKDRSGPFIANDAALDGTGDSTKRLWLVTGPNMAGKSTFLRQNALIAILAQIGAFVPARSATIGIVDRLFSRVGAADDLARGRSTFMVEMVEAAAILNQAGPRSFVILDELGRGTATYDGLSLAWAALEYLHEVNACRALFATHYHELTVLSDRLDHLGNLTMRVKEWEGDVVFLHEVTEGAADRSYGLAVAKLAGLPTSVLARAKTLLAELESGSSGGRQRVQALVEDLPLFAPDAPDPGGFAEPSEVEQTLEALNLDDITPREALDLLYRLKKDLAGA